MSQKLLTGGEVPCPCPSVISHVALMRDNDVWANKIAAKELGAIVGEIREHHRQSLQLFPCPILVAINLYERRRMSELRKAGVYHFVFAIPPLPLKHGDSRMIPK